MQDPISEFLGFDINEVADLSDDLKDQSKQIIKLIDSDEWQLFDKFLKMKLDTLQKPVELYAAKPEMAQYDSGYKRALLDIESFINSQKQIFEKYVDQKKDKETA